MSSAAFTAIEVLVEEQLVTADKIDGGLSTTCQYACTSPRRGTRTCALAAPASSPPPWHSQPWPPWRLLLDAASHEATRQRLHSSEKAISPRPPALHWLGRGCQLLASRAQADGLSIQGITRDCGTVCSTVCGTLALCAARCTRRRCARSEMRPQGPGQLAKKVG
jgi:hypothetical protein